MNLTKQPETDNSPAETIKLKYQLLLDKYDTDGNYIGNDPGLMSESYIRKEKYRPATTPPPVYVTLRVPLLDPETGLTGELWSKTNLLNWQN